MNEEEEQNYFDRLKWYYKNDFQKWTTISSNLNEKRIAFLGRKGNEDKIESKVIVKQIEINEGNHLNILKEEYFLACCKSNEYFVEIIDSILLTGEKEKEKEKEVEKEEEKEEEKDYKYNFLILREEGISLKEFINDKTIYYSKNNAEFILYRVACGLNILHKKGLSHNDTKPGNIVITGEGKPKICDMGSAEKVSKVKYGGTNGYCSPQVLLGKCRTDKDDMWSLGIVFLELLTRKTESFAHNTGKKMKDSGEKMLKFILEKKYDIKVNGLDWNTNIKYMDIIRFIRNGEYNRFQYKLKDEVLVDIKEENDKNVIENLLKINPEERWSVQNLFDSTLFKILDYKFIDSVFYYKDEDYNKYLRRSPTNEKEFIKFHEEIKQKYIGLSIFDKNKK